MGGPVWSMAEASAVHSAWALAAACNAGALSLHAYASATALSLHAMPEQRDSQDTALLASMRCARMQR